MNDTTPSPDPGDQTVPAPNADQTVPARSVPPISSGTYGHGSHLLQSGMMLPPQTPGVLGVIGKYQVIKILGEGGMGQVVLAREPVTDSMVAIKLIKAEFLHKQWAVHRFLTEARHMFRMSHGSILRVLDVSDRAEGPYFVMPFMPGGSLADKIKPGEALRPETILPVARAVAEALHHAHTRGITHRDLKPSNILLDAEGKAYLADFGLLRTFFNDSIVDASQPQMEGTVPYMSPAVAAGKAEDTRCDIYAFGCLLYEMLTGQPPYQGPTVDAVLKQIQDGPPPPIRQLNPHAPAHLTAIADHAMARELRDRYASMADVVEELERVAQGKAPLGTHGKVAAKPKNNKVLIAAGAAVLVGLLAFGISRISKTSPPPPIPPPGHQSAHDSRQDGTGSPETRVEGDFTYTVKDDAVTIVEYTGPGGDITIPHEIKGLPVAAIGEGAFRECAALTNVTIPDSVTTLGPRAFESCRGLTTVVIPGSVVDTGDRTFSECLGLTNVTMKNGVTIIGFASFANCSGLTQVNLPNTVNSIRNGAFSGCIALASITIPEGVIRIDTGAFYHCASLTEISIPASVASISRSFDRCTGLISIKVDPANPAYSSSPDGVLLTKDGTCLVRYPGGRPGHYDIPAGIRTVGVHAFDRCTYLTSVTLPESVTSIEQEAFFGCDNLTAVSFRGNAPKLGKDVFEGINKSAVFYYVHTTTGWGKEFGGRPTAVWEPEKDAKPLLSQTTGATPAPHTEGPFSYTVKDGAVTIVKYTGTDAEVRIPEMIAKLPVTGIGDYAFNGCSELTSVVLPVGVIKIGYAAFLDCSKLASITIPNRVTEIGGWAFRGCTSLTSISIPESVTSIGTWAFHSCNELTSVTIPASVTSLGAAPFRSCEKLTSIMVAPANPAYSSSPDGVLFNKQKTSLINCPGGKTGAYLIPDGVQTVAVSSFRGCATLISVTFPASVTSIESSSFLSCPEMTGLYFNGDIPRLGPTFQAFDSSSKATIYHLPTAKGWGKDFGGRPTKVWDPEKDAKPSPPETTGATPDPLTEGDFSYTVKDGAVTIVKYTGPGGDVKIPEKIKELPVTEIGQKAFFACVKMTRVTLPAGLIRLGDYAFDNCAGLTHVEIPSTVIDTGNFTFNRCYGLTNITIPGGVTRIGDYAFSACTSLPTITIPDSVTIIGARAFNGCSGLINITIPSSVTSIGGNAFLGCIKLTRVTIPANVATIGPDPFCVCSALVEIKVDEANPVYCSVDGVLFDKKNSILLHCPEGKAGNYEIPGDFTKIGPGAFDNCTKLTGVAIPNGVTEIGTNAFAGCTSLSSINIPASVSSIVGVPFSGCSALTAITVDGANPFYSSVEGVLFNKQKTVLIRCPGTKAGLYEIPGGVTGIRVSAFADCPKLSGITIPETVTEIGDNAFARCIGLPTITIPAHVIQITPGAFLGCGKLMSIKVEAANPAYSSSEDGVLFSKDKTKLVRCPPGKAGSHVVPDGVTSIESWAFADCNNLTDITIPDGVGQIWAYAFSGCSRLNRVEIGKGLRSIGQRAFYPCVSLTWVIVSGDAPNGDVHPEVFYGSYGSKPITVCHLPESKGWGKTFAGRPTALWEPKLRFCYTTDKDAATLIRYIGQGGDVAIPDKIGGFPVVSIAESAFQNCTTLTSLMVPEGVKSIMGRAFDGCGGLTKVTLPASVTSLGVYPAGQWNPFVNCPKLTSITVAASNSAYCSNADGILFNKEMTTLLAYPGGRPGSYTIPDGVTSVGLAAFEGCPELAEVKIHRGVTAVGLYAGGRASNPFQNCPQLLSITVDEANAAFSSGADGVLFSKDKGALLCHPGGKTGAYIVPDGVTSIGECAFAFCPGLSGVTLPASVTGIGYGAFMNSGELAAVWFKGDSPTNRISNAFQGADKATIYHLPTAKGWGPTYIGRPTAVWVPAPK